MSTKSTHIALGQFGEEYAARFLALQNFDVVLRNWRSSVAEIDIVARRGDLLVLCEVKTRSSNQYGDASEAIDARRLRRLQAAAEVWAAMMPGVSVRVDAICIDVSGAEVQLRHLEDLLS